MILDSLLDRALLGYGNVGYLARSRSWDELPRLDGKVIVVTGARGGLGRAAVEGLAGLGATVHMVVRGGDAAAPDGVVVDECDVSLLSSVRAFAARWEGPLYGLIHNAGTMPPQRAETEEGNELTLATHVLGPHLLTRLLPVDGRVVWVSSGGMYTQGLTTDLQYVKDDYKPATAYARTKRMQVVMAGEWARRGRVTSHSMHPGWVDTPGLASSLPGFKTLTRPILRTPAQGADTLLYLMAAVEPGQTNGRFWHDRAPRPEDYLPFTRASRAERDALWDSVESLTPDAP